MILSLLTMILNQQTDDYMFASNDISLLAMISNQQWFYMFSNNGINMFMTMILPSDDFKPTMILHIF